MKSYRTMDDISRDNEDKEREEDKTKLIKDVNDIFTGVFPKKKKKFSFFRLLGFILISLFSITFILGCVWLLKFFIGGIF